MAAVGGLFPQDDEVFLDEVVAMLKERLRSIDAVASAIRETVGYGETTYVDEGGWYVILALWLVENQLAERLAWNPSKALQRRPRPPGH
jgi:hypothetical protein